MGGFPNIRALADAFDSGRSSFCSFRKVPSQASVALNWIDLSMAAGNPPPNYYAASPLEATVLQPFKGLFHGDDKAPKTKHLSKIGITTSSANFLGRFVLLDYVLYYPFVDGDNLDTQTMVHTAALPRYTTGEGLQVIAVAVAPTIGGGSFTFTYLNQAGVEKTSPVISCNTAVTNIASLIASEQATAAGGKYFLPLADGDTGIRQINSVTFIGASGGLFAFVLVKPLVDTVVRELNTMHEEELLQRKPYLPVIEDGAYLNFIVNPAGSVAAAALAGYANFVWSE